jgi:hypothetical protein
MGYKAARFREFTPSIIPGIGIMLDMGKQLPPDGKDGYGDGCLFQLIGENAGLYINRGSNTSCAFRVYTQADFEGNLRSPIATGSITAVPTQAELVARLGAAASAGLGALRTVKGNAGTGNNKVYWCISDGVNWFAAEALIGT